MRILIKNDANLKPTPEQTRKITENRALADKLELFQPGGDYEIVHCSQSQGHHYVIFKDAPNISDRGFFWPESVEIINDEGVAAFPSTTGTGPGSNPKVSPENPNALPPIPTPVPVFRVPGISAQLKATDPIYSGGKPTNFTWGEATKNGERIPVNSGVTQRIVKVAAYMDDVRAYLGDRPIGITSWYRDPVSNEDVGGAIYSQHLEGNAVDFYVVGESVVDTFRKLKSYIINDGGLAVGSGFVHLDLRGWYARWRYSGGPNIDVW